MKESCQECPFEKYCAAILKKDPMDTIFVERGGPLINFLKELKTACRENQKRGLNCYSQNPQCGLSPCNWSHFSQDLKFLISIHTEPLGDIDFSNLPVYRNNRSLQNKPE